MEAYLIEHYPQWSYITQIHSWAIWNTGMSPISKWLLSTMAFGLVLFVGFAVVAIWAIFGALKENAGSFSEQTIKLHRQLTLALMAQASIPFFLYILPMGAAMVMLFLGYNNAQAICNWLEVIFCSHSNFNILLMVSLTSCYRECVVNWILTAAEKITGRKLRVSEVASAEPTQSEY
ncbi:unnamed protein product, partial [Mesorhabditis spiculigera]